MKLFKIIPNKRFLNQLDNTLEALYAIFLVLIVFKVT